MPLPINFDELINGQTVEWERIEFKTGWNPLDVLQTICAFANDINNWGGGYIILGVEHENGIPKFPVAGIDINLIDKIQLSILDMCHRLRPMYFPVVEPIT